MHLSDIEVRILGALVEKEAMTPDNYPLSLNALTTACNQTTNREPVMDLTDDQVRWAVNNLRQQSLVRAMQPSDARVMKYQHLLREKLQLEGGELAVMCVLMLRGPQTLGELRTRTQRLASFADAGDVHAVVQALAARELVVELPRQRGQKEERYAHLLAGTPAVTEAHEVEVVAPEIGQTAGERIAALEAEVGALRGELAELRLRFEEFRAQFG